MAGKVGDRIRIDSGKVGSPPREGEILEVIESPFRARYRVRWADGHETDIRPAGGRAMIIPAVQTKKRKGSCGAGSFPKRPVPSVTARTSSSADGSIHGRRRGRPTLLRRLLTA